MLLATESKENMKNNQDHAKRTQVKEQLFPLAKDGTI